MSETKNDNNEERKEKEKQIPDPTIHIQNAYFDMLALGLDIIKGNMMDEYRNTKFNYEIKILKK